MHLLKPVASTLRLAKNESLARTRIPPRFASASTSAGALNLAQARDDFTTHELNHELTILTQIFPGISDHVLHHMVTTFAPESRLYLITEALLSQNNPQTATRNEGPREGYNVVHSEAYKTAVKQALKEEFPNLSRSQIKSTLQHTNSAYTESRERLLEASRGRTGILNFFTRWTTQQPSEQSQLVIWPSPTAPDTIPRVRPDVQEELAQELNATIIQPLLGAKAKEQASQDHQIAEDLHKREAEQTDSLYECQCCYTSYPFESLSSCSSGDHFICHRCLQHAISEATYGQNWSRSVDPGRGTLTCFALSSGDACDSWIPYEQVTLALQSDPNDRQLLQRFDGELAKTIHPNPRDGDDNDFLRCPFCPYTEIALPTKRRYDGTMVAIYVNIMISLFGIVVLLIAHFRWHWRPRKMVAVSVTTMLIGFVVAVLVDEWLKEDEHHPTNGQKFICRSPTCSEISCLTCATPWTDPHTCFAQSTQSLRTYVEAAVSAAVKRTCPSCNVAFVKASGCNKMVCRCGTAICYLCRADVTKQKYQHFCNHFRPMGGGCTECGKCDLYRSVDEGKVIAEAKAKAEGEWWEMEREKRGAKGREGRVEVLERMRETVGRDGGLFRRRG